MSVKINKPIRNIGILAHVDAGKTSITENILYISGAIKSKGSVDKGSAVTDSLNIEKQRGISIKSASESFIWDDSIFNLIDTPGHTDFSSEVERILPVLDLAIIVISAAEGIQSHTINLTEALKKYNIPMLFFINKIDRIGADSFKHIKELNDTFNLKTFQLNSCDYEASEQVSLVDLWLDNKVNVELTSHQEYSIEQLAEVDETILETYLNGTIPSYKILRTHAIESINKLELTPVLVGSAKLELGIEKLLNELNNLYPLSLSKNKELSGFIYKIEHHQQLGKLAHIKIVSGQIKNRDQIYNISQDKNQKIALIMKYQFGKLHDTGIINSNDIGIISGIQDIRIGDEIGKPTNIHSIPIISPVLNIQIKPQDIGDYYKLANALIKLNIEDPKLNFKWHKDEQEMHLNLHGSIQREILHDTILEDYQIETIFEEPSIIYKETPISKAEGFVRYWMPKPCWAIMKFLIEPGKLGSGVQFGSRVGVNDIKQKFQNEVRQCIPQALEQGVKGWEVTDLKITLIEGEDHEVHSKPGDFNLATPMGVMRALENARTQLLEPLLRYEISTHESHLGAITSELLKMRANMDNHVFEDEIILLKGTIPVASSFDLSIKLNAICSGKFKYIQRPADYQICELKNGQTRAFKGVNPLDESKWILHKRGAYRADELK